MDIVSRAYELQDQGAANFQKVDCRSNFLELGFWSD